MKIDTTNTLTESQINDWKKQYKKILQRDNSLKKIYKSIVGEEVIIWRKLKRSEYIDIMTNSSFKDDDSNKSPYLRQDAIVKMCCLYPSNIDEIIEENGALSTYISDEIMLKSGFEITATTEM